MVFLFCFSLYSDPRGRAVLIGAIDKQKLVYILNRDSTARLTISSPLEAHKSNTVCSDMVGVDSGFDNPLFAVLEVEYDEVEWDEEGNMDYTKVSPDCSFFNLLWGREREGREVGVLENVVPSFDSMFFLCAFHSTLLFSC